MADTLVASNEGMVLDQGKAKNGSLLDESESLSDDFEFTFHR